MTHPGSHEPRPNWRRERNVRDRWFRFVSCVSKHPVTPILGLILGLQNLALGGVYLYGLWAGIITNSTILARLLDRDDRDLWLLAWAVGLAFGGLSQVYGVVRERWWCVVSGSNVALAALTFAAMVYATHLDEGWVALISPAFFTLALNAYLMILASVASMRVEHHGDFMMHFRHHRDVGEHTEESNDDR